MEKLTLFCDFDGPIVDVSDRYYKTYLTGLQEIQVKHFEERRSPSIQPMTKRQFWAMKQHRVPDVEIALRSGLIGTEIDIFLARVRQLVNQNHLLHYDQVQPGIDWAVQLLHSRGVRLILVTLRCQEQAIQLLRKHGLLSFFSHVYGTQDKDAAYLNAVEGKVSLLKQAWHDHLYQYGRPIQSWMLGDTEADICAGEAVGIPTVAITSGVRSGSYLQKFNPTYMFETLLDAAHGLMGRSPSGTSAVLDKEACVGMLRSTA